MRKLFSIEIPENRIFGLDLLRFFAITFVVIGHGLTYFPETLVHILSYFIFDGVTIFFVLSGYLIGGILIKILNKSHFDFKALMNFWKRRWFRTLPNYFLILTILFLLNLFNNPNFHPEDKFKYYLFIQNFKNPQPPFFPESWSLSIEEWFYILIPTSLFILITYFKKSIRFSIVLTVCFFIIFSTIFRAYRLNFNVTVDDLQIWDAYFRKQVITRLDSLIYGLLAAYVHFYYKNFWTQNKFILLFVGMSILLTERFILSLSSSTIYYSIFSFTLISIGTMMLLPYLSLLNINNSKRFSIITKISLISYSAYLIHLSLIQIWLINKFSFFANMNDIFPVFNLFIYLLLTYYASILLFKYFEMPMTDLRN